MPAGPRPPPIESRQAGIPGFDGKPPLPAKPREYVSRPVGPRPLSIPTNDDSLPYPTQDASLSNLFSPSSVPESPSGLPYPVSLPYPVNDLPFPRSSENMSPSPPPPPVPPHLTFPEVNIPSIDDNVPELTPEEVPWFPPELLPPVPAPAAYDHSPAIDAGEETSSLPLSLPLNLPQLPPEQAFRPVFRAEQLTVADLDACKNVWSLSTISSWLHTVLASSDTDMEIQGIQDALAKLVAYHLPNIPWTSAESQAIQAVKSLQHQGFIENIGNTVALTRVSVTGVMTELVGSGCYAPIKSTMPYRCYSCHCQYELPSVSRSSKSNDSQSDDWATYWGIAPSPSDEVKRQYALHELVTSEAAYVRDLRIFVDVYGALENVIPSVMLQQTEYCARVFGRVRNVLSVQVPFLKKLQRRQQEQGPWVRAMSDIVEKWAASPTTRETYAAYADDYLWSDGHLRKELARSSKFSEWMNMASHDPRLGGRPHSFFFTRIVPRLAKYELLLHAINKAGSESHIKEAEKACNGLATLCDEHIATQQRALDVQNLRAQIVFKSHDVMADLRLTDKRRRLIRRGDLKRKGRIEWTPVHLLLLDHFLILSKLREGQNGTSFYITRQPIPLDLLVIETVDDASHRTRQEELWPFHIKHLGSSGDIYVLAATSEQERKLWIDSLIEAKRLRCAAAFARSTEPFRLVQTTDAFGYPEADTPRLPVPIPSTGLQRCVDEAGTERIVLRRRINCVHLCAEYMLVGTDGGLWLGTTSGTWKSVIDLPRVTQVKLLPVINCLILVTEGNVVWYPLDQIIARGLGDKHRTLGHRLNRQKRVLSINTGFCNGRSVVIYLQSGLLKFLEPIRSHGSRPLQTASSFNPQACVDYFREFNRISVGSSVVGFTPFSTGACLHTRSNGVEWASIDYNFVAEFPFSTKAMGSVRSVTPKLKGGLLIGFEHCCISTDIQGNVIGVPTWFLAPATNVAYMPPYVIAVSSEMVEIRLVSDPQRPARLVQIITGKDLRLLSDFDGIWLGLAHPWMEGRQLVVELIGNNVAPEHLRSTFSSSTRSAGL